MRPPRPVVRRSGSRSRRAATTSRRRHRRYIPLMRDDPTLFEWAGGRSAFDRLINAFYDRVEQDDLLSPFFPGGVHQEHRRNVATWWSEVFGGPATYSEDLGGYQRMLHKYLQLGITDEQRF